MMDYKVDIPKKYFDMAKDLLEKGKIDYNGNIIDFSGVSDIKITGGELIFDPPVKISAKIGPVRLKTTITKIESKGSGIQIGIDNSPVDLELRPE